jgi:hypothetical protein
VKLLLCRYSSVRQVDIDAGCSFVAGCLVRALGCVACFCAGVGDLWVGQSLEKRPRATTAGATTATGQHLPVVVSRFLYLG